MKSSPFWISLEKFIALESGISELKTTFSSNSEQSAQNRVSPGQQAQFVRSVRREPSGPFLDTPHQNRRGVAAGYLVLRSARLFTDRKSNQS